MHLRNILIAFLLSAALAVGLMFTGAVGVWKHLTNSVRVHQVAKDIAEFRLPQGFSADYAVAVLGYTIVAYKDAEGQGHLTFMQAPPGVIPTGEMLAGYMTGVRSSVTHGEATLQRTEERMVRDKPAQITVVDHLSDDGRHHRVLNVVFEGREGTVLLVMNQSVARWNEDAVDAFIASIR